MLTRILESLYVGITVLNLMMMPIQLSLRLPAGNDEIVVLSVILMTASASTIIMPFMRPIVKVRQDDMLDILFTVISCSLCISSIIDIILLLGSRSLGLATMLLDIMPIESWYYYLCICCNGTPSCLLYFVFVVLTTVVLTSIYKILLYMF